MEHYRLRKYVEDPKEQCACLHSTISVPLHCHEDFYEFIVITCGSYLNNYNGGEELYKKNTLLMFQPGTVHSMTLAENNSAHFTFLASRSFMTNALRRYRFDMAEIFQGSFTAISLTYAQTNYLTSLSNAMINLASQNKQHIFQLFLHNIFYIGFAANSTKASDKDDNYIEILIERLNNFQYVSDEISSLYMDYPVAQCTLCALFKKRTGTTIVRYRNMKRMEYAAQLLTSWNYSVTDVANQINISCLSYFSKEFKAQFGITPKEYQKLHRKPYQGTGNTIADERKKA